MNQQRHLVLLGPQQDYRSLQQASERLGLSGTVALVTAGWEEDEDQDQMLLTALPNPAVNLRLFHRSERLFAEDPELIQQLQHRQDRLRLLRDVYRMRLDYASRAADDLIQLSSEEMDLDAEFQSAIEHIRQLDREYFSRTTEVCDEYDRQLQMSERKHVMAHRVELAAMLGDCAALIISGGHTAIILNRLRIFGVLDMNPGIPVIAWSGGAMALSKQIVVYHDWPAHGPSDPEVLRAGMGLFQDLLPLPDARHRLDLDNRRRVQAFANRFRQFAPVILDEQSILERRDGRWLAEQPVVQLGRRGDLEEFQPC